MSRCSLDYRFQPTGDRMEIGASGKVGVIQVLRGIAALTVLLWHASRYFSPYGTGWAAQAFQPGGNMGVDLFFLISGFIMVVTTRDCDGTPSYAATFMVKRLAR